MKTKDYTDLEQSKKLSEILSIESADMIYCYTKKGNKLVSPIPIHLTSTPTNTFKYLYCWSLTALLEVISYPSLHKTYLGWRCDSYNKEGTTCKLGEDKNNPIDACYKMVLKLHELNLL